MSCGSFASKLYLLTLMDFHLEFLLKKNEAVEWPTFKHDLETKILPTALLLSKTTYLQERLIYQTKGMKTEV